MGGCVSEIVKMMRRILWMTRSGSEGGGGGGEGDFGLVCIGKEIEDLCEENSSSF